MKEDMKMSDIETSESRVRHLARRNGYVVRKSRQRLHVPNLDNPGDYMLIEPRSNIPVLGFRFDATLADIEDFFARSDGAEPCPNRTTQSFNDKGQCLVRDEHSAKFGPRYCTEWDAPLMEEKN